MTQPQPARFDLADTCWVTQHPFTGKAVPVVPCDEAAVERVARLLFARSFVPMQTVGQVEALWADMEEDRREFLRTAARELFQVAGEES